MRRRRRAVLLALLAACAACGSSGSTSTSPQGTAQGSGAGQQFIAAADLAPCPASSTTPVAGGLPDLTVPCLGAGPAVHMAGLTGEPTVVNIWGSWCEPCQAEEKYLASAYDRDRAHVRFLGVDIVDQADQALSFDAKASPPVRYPSVFDEDRRVALGLHVASPPYTVFLSPAGEIVHTMHGAFSSTAQLQAAITRYLHPVP